MHLFSADGTVIALGPVIVSGCSLLDQLLWVASKLSWVTHVAWMISFQSYTYISLLCLFVIIQSQWGMVAWDTFVAEPKGLIYLASPSITCTLNVILDCETPFNIPAYLKALASISPLDSALLVCRGCKKGDNSDASRTPTRQIIQGASICPEAPRKARKLNPWSSAHAANGVPQCNQTDSQTTFWADNMPLE